MTRGEVVRLRSMRAVRGHEQRGARFAIILQSNDLLPFSTVIVAPTSTGAVPASFRPEIELEGELTRVMVDHVAVVDLSRIGHPVRMLTWDELEAVERSLETVLGLAR